MRQNRTSHVSGIQAFMKAQYVYLAIPKNGLCTHTEFFQKKGWKGRHITDLANHCGTGLTFIGHIRKPINRYIKGITQSLKNDEKVGDFIRKMKEDPTYLRYVLTSVNDDHTSSIWSMFPPQISPYQVNWIPMDHPKWDSNFLTNQLFRELNLPYKIEKSDITHISDKEPKAVQKFITEKMCWPNGDLRPGWGAFESAVLSEDQNIYNHVMRQYKVREPFYDDIFLKEFPKIPPSQPHWYPTEDDTKFQDFVKSQKKDDRPNILKTL